MCAEEKEFIHFSSAEPHPILFKDTASRAKNNQTCLKLLFRGAAYLIQRYRKPSEEQSNLLDFVLRLTFAIFVIHAISTMNDKSRILGVEFLSRLSYEPNEQQTDAIAALCHFATDENEHSIFLLNGYAGTGKTSLVSAFVKSLPSIRRQAVLLAPTGRAAKVFAAYSGHSAFTIHRKIYQSQRYDPENTRFSLARNNHKNTFFIVDEASMISNNAGENAVFGTGCLLDDLVTFVDSGEGCRLILLGDAAQLPPVGYSESPALSAEVLRSYGFDVRQCCLTDVVRQKKQSGILYNATAIREIITSSQLAPPVIRISSFPDIEIISGESLAERIEDCYNADGMDETIVVTRSNKRAVMFNQGIRSRVLYMEAEIASGDMILIAKNNYFWSEGYDNLDFIANGDVAVVRRISNETSLYGLRFADAVLELPDYGMEIEAKIILDALYSESPALNREQSEMLYQNVMADFADITRKSEKFKRLKKNPYFNALQVKFAYSVTCHKAQGGQWKNVFIDMGYIPENAYANVDFYRWLYTSFTRATKKIFLINPPLASD